MGAGALLGAAPRCRRVAVLAAMLPRVSAVRPLRPLARFPLCSGGSEAPAAATVLLGAPHATARYGARRCGPRPASGKPRPPRCSRCALSGFRGPVSQPEHPRGGCFKFEERETPGR